MQTSLSRILVLAGSLAVTAIAGCASEPEPAADAETVVLVHGLGRTPASMAVLAARLADAGYRVVNFGYPSRAEPIEDLVARLESELERCCANGLDEVHFVTHSMGGLLVRSYLSGDRAPHGGRVVMLSPPNQGSEIVDAFADSPGLRLLLGPAGEQLGTDSTGIASELGPVRFELGIITGDRSLDPIGSWLIPGPDDGKVAVERAKVEGAADFLVIPASHTFIMNRSEAAEEVVHFLKYGRFRRGADSGDAAVDRRPVDAGELATVLAGFRAFQDSTGQQHMISDAQITELEARGLPDPITDLLTDLRAHPDLIPADAALGGSMGFHDADGFHVLNGRWVQASFDDGHTGGRGVFEFTIDEGGRIHWRTVHVEPLE